MTWAQSRRTSLLVLASIIPRVLRPPTDLRRSSAGGASRPCRVASAAMANEPGTPVNMKPRSYEVTQGDQKAPARAMLRAIGMTDDDWDKPQVAVASSWNEVTPCNMPLDHLAKVAKEGV